MDKKTPLDEVKATINEKFKGKFAEGIKLFCQCCEISCFLIRN